MRRTNGFIFDYTVYQDLDRTLYRCPFWCEFYNMEWLHHFQRYIQVWLRVDALVGKFFLQLAEAFLNF